MLLEVVEHVDVEVLEGGGAALVEYLQHLVDLVRCVRPLGGRRRATPRPHARCEYTTLVKL